MSIVSFLTSFLTEYSIEIGHTLMDTQYIKRFVKVMEPMQYFIFPMVFIIDGCSFHYAHTWSKSGFSICSRHLVTSKELPRQVGTWYFY